MSSSQCLMFDTQHVPERSSAIDPSHQLCLHNNEPRLSQEGRLPSHVGSRHYDTARTRPILKEGRASTSRDLCTLEKESLDGIVDVEHGTFTQLCSLQVVAVDHPHPWPSGDSLISYQASGHSRIARP